MLKPCEMPIELLEGLMSDEPKTSEGWVILFLIWNIMMPHEKQQF